MEWDGMELVVAPLYYAIRRTRTLIPKNVGISPCVREDEARRGLRRALEKQVRNR